MAIPGETKGDILLKTIPHADHEKNIATTSIQTGQYFRSIRMFPVVKNNLLSILNAVESHFSRNK